MSINTGKRRRFFVYMHVNKINGKKYIGITGRDNPKWRWGQNGQKYHDSKYFYNAIQKYGWNNFEHIILFEKLTVQEAKEKEVELIAKYKTSERKYGYNITAGGDIYMPLRGKNNPRYGKHLSEETRKKISIANQGKKLSPESLKKMSESLKKYYAAHPGCNSHPATLETRKKMVELINEYNKTHTPIRTGAHLSEESRSQIAITRAKNGCAYPVRCLETGKTYISLREASRDMDISKSSIADCCKHKCESVKGYHFEYINQENNKAKTHGQKKKVICIDTNKIYDSLADAARELGVDKNRIWASCQDEIKTAKGLNFQYYGDTAE